MSKNRYVHRLLATGILSLALTVSACTPEKKVADTVDPNQGYQFAAVDYQQLIQLHPNYQSLLEIDQTIALKEQEKSRIGADAFKELQKEGAGKMKTAVDSAKAKLEAERSAIEGEMAALSASMSAQIEGEMRSVQQRLQDELTDDIEKLKKEAPSAADEPKPDPLLERNEGQIQDYLTNLSLVRERNLAARRLELEKRLGDEINAKKAEVDAQLAAYEAELSASYQGERLNLQLTAQNSVDEAAKTAAEERLAAISQEIDAKRSARRAELDSTYASLRSEKSSQLQVELEAYQNELNAEVNAKVAQKRRELGGVAAVAERPQTQGPPPEVTQKIAQMQARMSSELASRKAELESQMRAKGAAARERLESKQAQVQAELEALEKEISEELMARAQELSPETKAKVDKANEELENLVEQRKELADKIAADISREVGEVADKKGVDMVVGVVPKFEWTNYPDLTEQAKVAIQTEDSK